VDADFDQPTVDKSFGVDNTLGFRDLLADAKLPLTSVIARPMQRNLRVLTAGAGSESEISSEIVGQRMSELKLLFDFVLISASAADDDPLALALSRLTDGVLLVLRANESARDRTALVKSQLEAINVGILGAVLSGHTDPVPQRIRSLLGYFRF
jgi:Mrp family chromosome partitioning ATPase